VSAQLALVLGTAAATTAIKVAGPVLLGGRDMPAAFAAVVALLAPALLAALVVTDTLASGRHLGVGLQSAGVAAGGLVAWRTRSLIGAVVVAAALTAALRAL
jgi:branched-subunit amino acid transport protein